MDRVKIIEDYIDNLISDPKCELNYSKDYELLIAVMLSAQTTDKRVNMVTKVLFDKYDSIQKLKSADLNDLKSIVRPLGSYNKKALYIKEIATIICDKYNGVMPRKRIDLESMPGVGRKTINVVFGELEIEPNIAVDTHVERVSKRLGLAKENDNVLDVEMKLRKKFKRDTWNKRHKQLVLFGRYYCKAIKPECDKCKLKDICKRKRKNESYMVVENTYK
ncbi:MAG: endonuclease III [Bacilli bacterium]|nr:endonuclease III [Bacilli bacterium]